MAKLQVSALRDQPDHPLGLLPGWRPANFGILLPRGPGTEDQVRQTRNLENVGLTSLNLPDHRAVIMLRLPISSDGFGNIGLERMIDGRQALASQRGGASGDNCLPETAIPTLRSR